MAQKPADPDPTPNDREPPPDLAPLPSLGDEGDDDLLEDADEPEALAEHRALLQAFDDNQDLDDSNAADLDDGIEIEEDSEAEQAELHDLPIDVGDLLADAAELSPAGGGDDFGPADAELVSDVAEIDPVDPRDDAEGMEQADELLDEELPKLNELPDDDIEGAVAEDADALPEADEEEPPGRTELPWLEVPLAASRRGRETLAPRHVVQRAGQRVVAAGADVVRIDGSDVVEKLGALPDAATSIFVDAEHDTVVLTTAQGDLFRIAPSTLSPERLVSFRLAGLTEPATELTLGGPTPSSRPAVLLRSGHGALLESTDRGTTWRAVDLGGRVLALSSGTPPLCVVETKSAARLFHSEPSGGFSPVGQEWPFEVERIGLAAEGDIVTVLEPARGVHVSADGGARFRRVAGTARATAVAVGRLGSRPSAFTALFDPASGRAHVAWIDAVSAVAYIVGEIEPATDDEEDDWARVASLAWDAHTETLWAAGAFGLRRFRRPASA